jgi:NAD(P)-dependent dehydrogenase (short-subunit alcohol dehydrogenase family)
MNSSNTSTTYPSDSTNSLAQQKILITGAARGLGEDFARGAIAAGANVVPLHERIPEKFRVLAEGDKFDLEGSAGKMADAYSALEKRLGTGDLPPDAPEKYQIDGKAIAEDFDADNFMKDESTQSFLKAAHAKGMTNAQVQFAIEYALKEFAPQMVKDQATLSSDQCVQSLSKEWGDQHADNFKAANRAFLSLPDDLRGAVDKELGNNPAFVKVMALFGKEMSEDSSAANATGATIADIQTLMASPAYNDPNHAEHARVSEQVRQHYARQHRTA